MDKGRKEVKEWRKRDKVMYERSGIQRMTDKEVSGSIYWSIYH